MKTEFIGQTIKPIPGTLDTARMASGEPGLPRGFTWGQDTIEIAEVIRTWKESGPCHHGSGEQYLRKHWYEVRTSTGTQLTLYFERQPRGRTKAKQRWWLFSRTA